MMLKKIVLLTRLFFFTRRFPQVKIIGGPRFLRFFCPRRIDRWPGFYSQAGQDSFLCTHFFNRLVQDGFPRIFMDVGCNHPVKHNNSYFFEKHLGFKVIAVDALNAYRMEWVDTRPGSEFICTAVGDSPGTIEFEIAEGSEDGADMFSSVAGASGKSAHLNRKKIAVEVRTIDSILAERNIQNVGIVSLDIEGYELNALHGIDFSKARIMLFVIENNTTGITGNDAIRERLIANGYVFYARIWGMDDVFVHPSMLAT
jgi:FkbM family methyltransferase